MSTALQDAKAHIAAKRGQTHQRLQEVAIQDHTPKVDDESGIIRKVKILGAESRNGRRYTEQAMRKAAELYEGVTVLIDHRDPKDAPERGFSESFGELRSCYYDQAKQAVYGDLHYLKSHPLREMVIERIARGMRFGLSHDAEGPVAPSSGGAIVVEDLTKVHSVDIVLNPATNQGLFEHEESQPVKLKTIKQVLESCKDSKAAKRLLEMSDAMDYPVDEMEMEPMGEPEADVASAVSALVTEVIKDPNIDPKTTKDKVGKILDVMVDEPPPSDVQEMEDEEELVEEDEENKDDAMSESVKVLRDEIKTLKSTISALQESVKEQVTRPRGVRALRESEQPSGTLGDYLKSAKRR